MTKTETFNELAKQESSAQIMFDIGHLTAQLRKADQESIKELSGTIKPLAEAMSTLVQKSAQAIQRLEDKVTSMTSAVNSVTSTTETARLRIREFVTAVEERKEIGRQKFIAMVIGLAVLSSIVTASMSYVWQSRLSDTAKRAKNWEAFENHVWPQLSLRDRDMITRAFESSSKR